MKTLFLFLFFFASNALGSLENTDVNAVHSDSQKGIKIFPVLKTVFPIFAGGGVGLNFQEHFEIDLLFGQTPVAYTNSIGSTAASISGNPSYKNVIDSAFQNNSIWQASFKYHFNSTSEGWHAGVAYARLTSSGQAGIDSVLSAATGYDFTSLKNALTSLGRSSLIEMNSSLNLGEIHAGWTWELKSNLTLTGSLGIAKVTSSEVELKTGLPIFEDTNAGQTLISNSESELESIISDYGVSPTLGLSLRYFF